MTFAPRFRYTEGLVRAAEEIGAYRATLHLLPLPLAIERRLRREARVRVAHNSTWIENRTLALEEAADVIADKALRDPTRARTEAAKEVRNYFDALAFIDSHPGAQCDESFICRLHAIIMRGSKGGRPRERSAFREEDLRVGNFDYVPPAWQDVPGLMAELCAWATGPGLSLPRFLFAAILAYRFVTIHPFVDGNGRTCRALATWALRGPNEEKAIDPTGLLNIEELYAANLDAYYDKLQMGLHWSYYDANHIGSRADPDLTPWLEYFADLLARSASGLSRTIAAHFRAAHAAALADPIADFPRPFRRLLLEMPDAAVGFGPSDVSEWLQISDRTARTWLKDWQERSLIRPERLGAQRIHKWKLTAEVIKVIHLERQNDAPRSGSRMPT